MAIWYFSTGNIYGTRDLISISVLAGISCYCYNLFYIFFYCCNCLYPDRLCSQTLFVVMAFSCIMYFNAKRQKCIWIQGPDIIARAACSRFSRETEPVYKEKLSGWNTEIIWSILRFQYNIFRIRFVLLFHQRHHYLTNSQRREKHKWKIYDTKYRVSHI